MVGRHHLGVDLGSDAVQAEVGVDGKREIEHRAVCWQFQGAPLGREKIDFLCVERLAKLLDQIDGTLIGIFERGADLHQPLLNGVVYRRELGMCLLVEEVGSHTLLRYGVHADRAYLYLHPASYRSHDRCLERLIPVVFRGSNPVAETRRILRELACDE